MMNEIFEFSFNFALGFGIWLFQENRMIGSTILPDSVNNDEIKAWHFLCFSLQFMGLGFCLRIPVYQVKWNEC